MRKATIAPIVFAVLSLSRALGAQQPVIEVKGGHQLGETAEMFFGEGYERGVLSACATGDFKGINKPDKRVLKKYCNDMAYARQQAMSGKRYEYTGGGDLSEMRTDTFTFEGRRLVRVELLYSVPSAEANYRGQSFEKIFAGIKQVYGPPTNESIHSVRNAYGVEYLAHRELWLTPQAAIVINEQPGEGGSTALVAFTRAEYNQEMAQGVPQAVNPLQ